MTLLTADGTPLLKADGGRLVAADDVFFDSFQRANGVLGNGWTDGTTDSPLGFSPLGIVDGTVRCTDPDFRTGTYPDPGDTPFPPGTLPDGELYYGIGCAYKDIGTTDVVNRIRWAGYHDTWAGNHVEGGAICHVVPGHPLHSIGVWPSEFPVAENQEPIGLLFLGYLGDPCENPVVVAAAPFDFLADGTPMDVVVRSSGGYVTGWLNGVQINWAVGLNGNPNYGLDPVPVDADLASSTVHGFAMDAHLVFPWENIPNWPAILESEIRGW